MPRRARTAKAQEEPDFEFFEDEEPSSNSSTIKQRIDLQVHDLLARWYWMALGLLLGVLGSLYYLSKAPKIYRATATLLVKQAVSNVVSSDGEEERLDLRYSEALNTVAEQVMRASLLDRVARDPRVQDLDNFVPPSVNWGPEWGSDSEQADSETEMLSVSDLDIPSLGSMIAGWTSVSVRRNTRLLDIQVAHPDPDCAEVLANAIAENYIQELGANRTAGRGSATEILEEKSQEAKELLQTKENALANYEQILELLADHKQKELVFSELDRRYLPKHPKWIKAREALNLSQKRFLSEFVLIRGSAADQDYWEKNRKEWDQPGLDQASSILVARRLLTARATVLQSEIKSQREIYDDLLTRYRAKLASSTVVESEVESSSPAVRPGFPSSPNTKMVLVGGGLGGLALGFSLAFLLTKLDTKIHSIEQLEMLTDLPLLATIRDTPLKLLDRIIAEKDGAIQNPPANRSWDPRIVFRHGLSETIYAEMYRILRASVTLLGDEKARRVTLFSSALPGDGKTLVSSNFAFASASQGKKTILVDLDLRKPAVHKIFGMKRSEVGEGISEILANQTTWREVVVEDVGQENLSLLLCGSKAPSPGELLDRSSIEQLLDELREEFDVVVVDSAPLLAVSDTRLLVPFVDNFCLVIRAEQTPKGAVRKVGDFLNEDNLDPCGVILNAYKEKSGRFARGGYYGAYGQYGKGYGYGGYGSYGSDEDE